MIRNERETYLIALVCNLSNINIEKKVYGFAFLRSIIATANKSLRTVKKNRYIGNVRMTKVPNEATL